MGLEVLAAVAAVAAVGSAGAGIIAGNQQRAAGRHAADLQRQAQSEQAAQNTAKAAAERRQQVRDERIRIARIDQSAANTGTTGSSGELGATSSIATQTSNNVGINLGAIQAGNNISALNQQAADSIFQGQQAASTAQDFGSIFGAVQQGATAFGQAAYSTKKIPGTATE